MKTDDILLFGGLAVGAWYLLSPQSTYAASPSMYPPTPGTSFIPSGGSRTMPTTDPTAAVISDVSNLAVNDGAKIIEAAGGALATVGIAAVHAGATVGGALVALATNPITWAVAGAVGIGYLWYRSQAHHQADEWVQGFQNPFDKTMASIDDHIEAGQITGEQAYCLRQAAVADYLEAMKNFASQGDNQALVIRQATQTFIYWYKADPDTYLANIAAWLQATGYQCV